MLTIEQSVKIILKNSTSIDKIERVYSELVHIFTL